MKHLILLFLFLNVFFTSCDTQSEIKEFPSIIYSKKLLNNNDIFEIKLDARTSNISTGISYYEDTNSWLFNLNHYENEIQMYDMNEKTFHRSFQFPIEGNEGIGKIFGFHVHNLDSIFLFNQNTEYIFLTDTSGIIKKRIRYETPKEHTPAFVLTSHYASSPFVYQKKMIVKTRPALEHRSISNKELSSTHFTYVIDLDNGETSLTSHLYPGDYLSSKMKDFDFSFAVSPSKIVYSLFADHNLYYSTSPQSALKVAYAPSKYIKGEFPEFPVSGTRQERYKYFATSPHYKSLVYDKYRDVYYRFCYPAVDTKDEKEILKLRFFPDSFSIMILDNSLNIIGETLIEDSKYLANIFFINEEGLYISTNHPDNPGNKEDYMTFALFTLEDV